MNNNKNGLMMVRDLEKVTSSTSHEESTAIVKAMTITPSTQ